MDIEKTRFGYQQINNLEEYKLQYSVNSYNNEKQPLLNSRGNINNSCDQCKRPDSLAHECHCSGLSLSSCRRGEGDDAFMAIFLVIICFFLMLILIPSFKSVKGTQNGSNCNNNCNTLEQILTVQRLLGSSGHIVNISQGLLQGKKMITREGREYLAFLGIPYGKPPVNELRFKAPMSADGWTGIRNASVFGSECMQYGRTGGGWKGIKGNEDCLNLNIYTPKTIKELSKDNKNSKLLPVLVYFHGGGLAGNVFHNGGEYFLDEDVILVTIHYRLGPFGNLNLHMSFASGNQGLKDQVLALKWIQTNIAQFGGDKNKVLLFGESSGGASITGHLLSPMSKGLFSRVIVQSGSILVSNEFSRNTVQDAVQLGTKVNCTTTARTAAGRNSNLTELVECLLKVEAKDLVVKTSEAVPTSSYMFSVESIDSSSSLDAAETAAAADEEIFLSESALKLYQSGKFSNYVPAIFGINNYEGIANSLAILKIPGEIEKFNTNLPESILHNLKLYWAKNSEEITAKVCEFYFPNYYGNISAINSEIDALNLTNLFSDRFYIHPVYITAYFTMKGNQFHAENKNYNNAPVYLYEINEQVSASYWIEKFGQNVNVTIQDVKGAGHLDELQFLFENAGYNYPSISMNSSQYNFSRMLVHLWASFADKGVPDTNFSPDAHTWEPISEPRPLQFYQLDSNHSSMSNNLNARMHLWDSFNLHYLYM